MKPRMRVSILTLSLLATTAWTGIAAAETLTVTDIETKGEGGLELRVPTIEAVDANVDEAAIRMLFTEDFAKSADMLAGLDAASIRIPELILEYDVPDETGGMTRAQFVYSDFELTSVEDGIAAKTVIGGMTMTGETQEATFALGKMSMDNLDMGAMLGFYGLTSDRPSEIRTVYENYVLEGGSITGDDINCIIGSASAGAFRARPLEVTFTELMSVASELQAAETSNTEPSPEAIAAMIDFYADLMSAMESEPSLFEGLSCEGKGPDGKEFALSAGPAVMDGFQRGIYPGFALDNFVIEADDGWFRLGNFTWKPMDIEDALENLAEAKGEITEEWLAEHWRFLIPQIQGMSLADLAMDIPAENGSAGRVQAAIGSFDLSLADFVNGIPATISTNATDIDFTIPEGDEGDALRSMGIEKLSLGYDIAASWNEDDKTIAIERLSLAADDLGGIAISGTLANAGRELFSERNEVALAAAMSLTVTDLKIEVENAGALSLILAAAAADENQPPESFQVVAAGMAQALPLAVLGGTPDAVALSNALGAFMAGTSNLTLTLTSTDPRGIGLAELMAAEENPAVLKDKVKIAAETSGEVVPFVWPEPATQPTPPPAPPAEPGTGKTSTNN